jgi:DNA polymerase-1
MVSKYEKKARDEKISRAVIGNKTTKSLKESKAFITDLLELRKSTKLKTTYVTGTRRAIENNGYDKVYFDFRFDGTVTGRLSCGGATKGRKNSDKMGVSFHTLPQTDEDYETDLVSRNIRSQFVAPSGWSFLAGDYSQMELRVLAVLANEGSMKKAFLEGRDIHTSTASLIFGVSENQVTKKQRNIAKTVNFLIVYGGGEYNLSETAGITMVEAENVFVKYRENFPKVFSYMEIIKKRVMQDEYVTTLFGRRRHLPNVRSNNKKVVAQAVRQANNFTVQSPASDVMLCAIDGVCEDIENKSLLSRVVATVHDSVEIISPFSTTIQTLEIMRKQMMNPPALEDLGIEFDVPLVVDLEVGASFGDLMDVEFDDSGKVSNEEEIMEYLGA